MFKNFLTKYSVLLNALRMGFWILVASYLLPDLVSITHNPQLFSPGFTWTVGLLVGYIHNQLVNPNIPNK